MYEIAARWEAGYTKKQDVGFYFARPYHSWEHGANENTNGLEAGKFV